MLFEDAYDFWVSGRLTQEQAAGLLGVSDRTFRRWSDRYEDGGVDALIDKRLGRDAHNAAARVPTVMACPLVLN